MLLRDDRQMAVGQVETLSIEAADHYRTAVDKAGDPALASLFAELGQQHQQFAHALAQHIRASGDLPQAPDPDKEAAEDMLANIKGLLRGNVRDTLLDERLQSEQTLADAVRAALKHDLEADLRRLMEDMLSHAEAAGNRLAMMRA